MDVVEFIPLAGKQIMKNGNDIFKISVVMSAYNAEKFIKEAIDSILSQTFPDFEFIIINDTSTDSTGSIIESYRDPRILLINNEKNMGLTKSLNIGLNKARGTYIVRMDADDISFPQRFQKQFDFMEQNPDVDVCGSWYEFFGGKTGIVKHPLSSEKIKATLFFYNCIAHPTVMIRKESFEKYNIRYDEEFFYAQDYELWCREIDRLNFANIPEVLLKYRVTDKQTSTDNLYEQIQNTDKVLIRNLEKKGLFLTEREKQLFCDYLVREGRLKDRFAILEIGNIVKKIREVDEFNKYFKDILYFRWWRALCSNVEGGYIIIQALCAEFPFLQPTVKNFIRFCWIISMAFYFELKRKVWI